MPTGPGRLFAAAGLLLGSAWLFQQCTAKPPDLTPIVSIKELMENMIDPISDNVFDAVWTDISKKGIVEYRPRNDEDWAKVKVGAVTLAEGIYLLKIPRPWTPGPLPQ